MLIEWRYTADLNDADVEQIAAAAAELLRAHRRGYHWLVIDRQVAALLLTLPLSASDHALIRRLGAGFAQTGAMQTKAHRYLNIVPGGGGAENAIPLKLSEIIGTEVLSPAALLVENAERDGWLYSLAIRNAGHPLGATAVHISAAHGGGDDIAGVLDGMLKSRRIVHAVVDSDKSTPASAGGTKYRKLLKVIEKSGSAAAFVSVPPCREAENVLPMDVVLSLPGSSVNTSSSILLALEHQERQSGVQISNAFWLFFDVKEGISKDKLEKLTAEEAEWVMGRLSLVGIEEKDLPLSGYGSKCIDVVKDSGEKAAECRRLMRSGSWQAVFGDFIRDVSWTFCAPRVLRT